MRILFVMCLSLMAEESASRTELYRAVVKAGLLDPDRKLVHFSQTCTLRVDGGGYAVLDVREVTPSATSPRGINSIVVLNPALKPVRKIEYTTQRPLFCAGNRLYVYGDLAIENVEPEGNVITFSKGGAEVRVSHIEARDYPAPTTRDAKAPPQ